MAVEDKYIDANVAAGKQPASVAGSLGAETRTFMATFELAAADDDGSIYRVFKNLSADLIPVRIEVRCDAITNGTVFDLGFYKTGVGSVEANTNTKSVLMSNQTLASALTTSPADGLANVDIANRCKRIYELCAHTQATKLAGYDLCLVGDTVGTVAGTVTIIAVFAQG